MKRIIYLFLMIAGFLPVTSEGQSAVPSPTVNIADTFPVPKPNKNMLFYVQRTHNKNTIVYELNLNQDSSLNESEPVKIYWIRYSDKGEIMPLTYLQRRLAYGLEAVMIDKDKKIFKINFVSYKKRDIYLMRSQPDGRYHAFLNINGKMVFFTKAFARIDGGTFRLPHIAYVEIRGQEPVSGKVVSEKIIP